MSTSFASIYESCEKLYAEAEDSTRPMVQVEALLYYIRLTALEQANARGSEGSSNTNLDSILATSRRSLLTAKDICAAFPGQTAGMAAEIEAAEKAFREETFYQTVTNEEKRAIIEAMNTELM